MPASETEIELAKIEIEYLRKEIEYRTADQAEIEKNVIIGVAAIYIALATLKINDLQDTIKSSAAYLWYAPILLVVVARTRFSENDRAIARIGEYLATVETRFGSSGGWENYLKTRDFSVLRGKRLLIKDLTKIRILCWWTLLAVTIAIPLYINFCVPLAPAAPAIGGATPAPAAP